MKRDGIAVYTHKDRLDALKKLTQMHGFVKTKVGVVIATIIFLALIIFGELTSFGDLFPQNEITKVGVPKYRIHILKIPKLEKVASKSTDLNSSVILKQLGKSRVFRAWGGKEFFDYFLLNKDWAFEKPGETALENLFKEKSTTPHYSVGLDEKKVTLKENDKDLYELDFKEVRSTKEITVSTFNDDSSLLLNFKNNEKLAYLKDLRSPKVSYLNFSEQVTDTYFDENDSRIYAKIKEKDRTGVNASALGYKLLFIDILDKKKSVHELNCALQKDSRVFYNATAKVIGILDKEKFRILNRDNGNVIEINYMKEMFPQKLKHEPTIVSLTKVPAAIINNLLIDLRDGSLVEKLPRFGRGSLYLIDYKNKFFYYVPASESGTPSMEIASYDLHNLALKLQIRLGSKNSEESNRKERKDSIADMFITDSGRLVCLSKPQ